MQRASEQKHSASTKGILKEKVRLEFYSTRFNYFKSAEFSPRKKLAFIFKPAI